jgi:aryl-alcohol dehydrogenase-like predicted oxidoreductase
MATLLKLNTGATIPALGFGTWQDKDDQAKAVTEALRAGFTHIDTARGMQHDSVSSKYAYELQSMELSQWLAKPSRRAASTGQSYS